MKMAVVFDTFSISLAGDCVPGRQGQCCGEAEGSGEPGENGSRSERQRRGTECSGRDEITNRAGIYPDSQKISVEDEKVKPYERPCYRKHDQRSPHLCYARSPAGEKQQSRGICYENQQNPK